MKEYLEYREKASQFFLIHQGFIEKITTYGKVIERILRNNKLSTGSLEQLLPFFWAKMSLSTGKRPPYKSLISFLAYQGSESIIEPLSFLAIELFTRES